jgi:hypothetical protein
MANTFVDLKGKKKFTITDFTGGLNENARVYAVKPNELQACSNMEIRKMGALVVRAGTAKYEQAAVKINIPATDQFYYVNRDGTRKMVMFAGNTSAIPSVKTAVYIDNDAGVYTSLIEMDTADGHCRFTQYRDTLFFGTDDGPTTESLSGFRSYNSTGGIIQIYVDIMGEMGTSTQFTDVMTNTKTSTGGFLEPKYYAYRLCWEISHDNDFMGESYPVWYSLGVAEGAIGEVAPDVLLDRRSSFQQDIDHTSGSTETNIVEFKKPASTPSDFPTTATIINIYRSGPYDANDEFFPQTSEEDRRFFLIGSISADTYSSASVGTVLFTDRGEIPLGVQIRYIPTHKPPRPRFLAVHKDRLWFGYVMELHLGSGDNALKAHRIYASEFREPYVFPAGSWVDVQPNEGEGITGMVSWRNKIMLVFKNNSTYAIVGGDDVDFAGNPDISVEIISEDIGCIAPNSIVQAEGRIMWLSHRGVYYFDGTIPQPLKNVNIEDTLRDLETGTDYDSSMGYFSLERELWVGHSTASFGGSIQKFNFVTGAWSKHTNPSTEFNVAVSSFVEKNAKNVRPEFYMGIDSNPAGLDDLGVVHRGDTARWFDEFTGDTNIPWSFKTKQFDFNTPWASKNVRAIGLDCNIPDSTGVTVRITCDDRLDTNTDPGGDFTIAEAIVGHKLIMMDNRIRGKKIGFEISGTQTTGPTEFYALNVYYEEEEAVIDE